MEPGLGNALGATVSRAQYVQKYDESAVVWCANLLGMETGQLKEILRNVSVHYREFWMRKRKGGYRMISAPNKTRCNPFAKRLLIQRNIYHVMSSFRQR